MMPGYAIGLSSGMLLGRMLEETRPIDFKCKFCVHSYTKHENGECSKGLINKCGCTDFEIDEEQVKEAFDELKKVEQILFKYYNDAKQIAKKV